MTPYHILSRQQLAIRFPHCICPLWLLHHGPNVGHDCIVAVFLSPQPLQPLQPLQPWADGDGDGNGSDGRYPLILIDLLSCPSVPRMPWLIHGSNTFLWSAPNPLTVGPHSCHPTRSFLVDRCTSVLAVAGFVALPGPMPCPLRMHTLPPCRS